MRFGELQRLKANSGALVDLTVRKDAIGPAISPEIYCLEHDLFCILLLRRLDYLAWFEVGLRLFIDYLL